MNIITKLNLRQKIMLVLTLLATAFLVWQIYSFVRGNAPSQPLPVTATPAPVATPQISPIPVNAPVVRQLPTDTTSLTLSPQQHEYLALVHEYQVTKMRRQILEEQAGLANAQKRISDVGKGGLAFNMDTGNYDVGSADNGYRLAYLDRQAGQWTAAIYMGGQYQEVHVGRRLADGSKVVSIDNKGVVLQPTKGKAIVLGFQGSVNIDGSESHSVTSPAATKKAKPAAKDNVKPSPASNNAKIAKMLGITTAPSTPVAATVSSSSDIPAAPLATTLQPAATATTPSASTIDQALEPTGPAEATQSQQPSAVEDSQSLLHQPAATVTAKPVSVKELREHSADTSTEVVFLAPAATGPSGSAANLQTAALSS